MSDHDRGGRTCIGCDFAAAIPGQTGLDGWLTCRRRAPVVVEQPREGVRSVFPMVGMDDWCGEWVRRA